MTKNTSQPKQIYTLDGERYVTDKTGHQLIPLIEEIIVNKEPYQSATTTEKYLTCDDVAARYGVKKITVWSWIREKKLNAIQFGRNYRIRPEDIREFDNARMTKNLPSK